MKKLLLYGILGIFLIGIVVAVLEDAAPTPATGATPVPIEAAPIAPIQVEPIYCEPGQDKPIYRKPGQAESFPCIAKPFYAKPGQPQRISGHQKRAQAKPSYRAAKTDSKTQQKRKNLIHKLIQMGVFYKTEITGTLPKLWIAPGFYTLAFDDKQKFVSVVAAYYLAQSPRWNIIVLKDSRTGKRIGHFDERGLRLE